ncbi:hypothetical protein EZV73_27580 [Acidaminobacter sp. JC074]|uniref:ABC transporter permease subunit n=1 Tax=Acidaminobacter sp. JC074 TaxID=2530199 RepID=UPI001F10CA38|nr:ABC transporter permease subunit [Acidaminobacter sp. JC074]MCH4891363.1 hypothetical protein [Acidaminobacter sp. JC074]
MMMFKSELYKLKKSKAFWVSILIVVLFAFGLAFAFSENASDVDATTEQLSMTAVDLMDFSYGIPALSIVAAIFTSIFVSSEFQYGTMKNYISKGASRTSVFIVKLLVSYLAVTIIFIALNTTLYVLGSILIGYSTIAIMDLMSMLFVTWLLFMAYTTLFVAVGFSARNSASVISINICIVVLVPVLLTVISFLLSSYGVTVTSLSLEGTINAVMSVPLETNILFTGCITAASYVILSVSGGLFHFKKVDVK